MSLKNYLQFSWKDPELQDFEKDAHDRKHRLLSSLKKCESRLETIEICNSNSKFSDSVLLSRYLVLELFNALLVFYHQNSIENFSELKLGLDRIPNAELVAELDEKMLSLDFFSEEEENALLIEERLVGILYFSKNNLFNKHKEELYSPLDFHRKRKKFQLIAFSVLLTFLFVKLGIEYYKRKPLGPDQFTISYSAEKTILPDDSNKKDFPVKTSGEWNQIEVEVTSPLSVLKIVPCHQKNARVQIRNLKIVDKDNKILYENSLLYDEKIFLELSKLFQLENVEPGNLRPGNPLELISLSNLPTIYFKLPLDYPAVKLSLEVRLQKKVEKFKSL